ncbi:hypothetical protein chiPu_0024086 [Chiloscyllium punctatum]|uniref:Uncharacterized protein n=1 Tax=Chiloscyllium punctatum TaxID=137246 RepID=A0A401TBN3_CHIPU|nr:hypothetical protein [Chiloscyllium punctatum]
MLVSRRNWNEPRKEVPFPVSTDLPTAVQVEERYTRSIPQMLTDTRAEVDEIEEGAAEPEGNVLKINTPLRDYAQLVSEIFADNYASKTIRN